MTLVESHFGATKEVENKLHFCVDLREWKGFDISVFEIWAKVMHFDNKDESSNLSFYMIGPRMYIFSADNVHTPVLEKLARDEYGRVVCGGRITINYRSESQEGSSPRRKISIISDPFDAGKKQILHEGVLSIYKLLVLKRVLGKHFVVE